MLFRSAGRDDRNRVQLWLREEWQAAGLKMRDADRALGTNGMAGHYFNSSQWSLPTWEAYERLAAYAAQHGPPRERPYLVHPSRWPGDLRASYDYLRPPFTCPHGVGNVWALPQVAGTERLKGPDGATLHPCQKPLLFAERKIGRAHV